MRKIISYEERKHIMLNMLQEIDVFCRQHNIRYSLAFGTLLGAIRHKGFIPWDDDVDIMMPLPDMLYFKAKFQSETLEYLDIDTSPHYQYAFSRITNKLTYTQKGLFAKSYGISIDLYPCISISDDYGQRQDFFLKAEHLQKKRLMKMKLYTLCRRFLPITTIPGHDNAIKDYRDFMFNSYPYGSTSHFYIIAGPLEIREKMSYEFDLFKDLVETSFEGYSFKIIANYDDFLTLRYDNYMQLPPENERKYYHGGKYTYWK